MKTEIDLPEWAMEQILYLITRSELVASKSPGAGWKIKSVRCNRCGRCCEVHPMTGAYFPTKTDGSCVHLSRDGSDQVCVLGMEKPLACVLGEPEGEEKKKFNCCIEYK